MFFLARSLSFTPHDSYSVTGFVEQNVGAGPIPV